MATTTNSFQALLGAGGEAAVNAGSKKKKKNKSKKLAANDLQAGAVNPDNTSQTRGSKVSNDTSQVRFFVC